MLNQEVSDVNHSLPVTSKLPQIDLPVVDLKDCRNFRFSDSLFVISELANHFGVSKAFLYELAREGAIKPVAKSYRGKIEVTLFGSDTVALLGGRFRDKLFGSLKRMIATVANMKGGVGKSTITGQLAMTYSSFGFKVLAIDFDPQAHLSKIIHLTDENLLEHPTMKEILSNEISYQEATIQVTPTLHLIPANLRLSRLELGLSQMTNGETRLIGKIQEMAKDYDVVLIDTAPSPSLMNISVLAASDDVLIVTETDFLSTEGMNTVMDVLSQVEQAFSKAPKPHIIANQFDSRISMAKKSLGQLQVDYGDILLPTVIGTCQDLKEAQTKKQAIWQYNRKSTGAKDILSLAHDIMKG